MVLLLRLGFHDLDASVAQDELEESEDNSGSKSTAAPEENGAEEDASSAEEETSDLEGVDSANGKSPNQAMVALGLRWWRHF